MNKGVWLVALGLAVLGAPAIAAADETHKVTIVKTFPKYGETITSLKGLVVEIVFSTPMDPATQNDVSMDQRGAGGPGRGGRGEGRADRVRRDLHVGEPDHAAVCAEGDAQARFGLSGDGVVGEGQGRIGTRWRAVPPPVFDQRRQIMRDV